MIKPRWGSASIGIAYAEDADDLAPTYHLIRRQLARSILAEVSAGDLERAVLIQERIGGQEYGLDVVTTWTGVPAAPGSAAERDHGLCRWRA